jgi:hypothetical protein
MQLKDSQLILKEDAGAPLPVGGSQVQYETLKNQVVQSF